MEIRRLDFDDVSGAVALVNSQLGEGYLEEFVPSGREFGLFVDGKLVSYSGCSRKQFWEANLMLGFSRFVTDVYYMETTVTDPKYQRMGFGTILKKAMIAELDNIPMYATLWQSKNGVNAERMNLACGFKKERWLRKFYINHNTCPDCGVGNACQCSAWLFVRE